MSNALGDQGSIIVSSPAKLNLCLKIVGRQADGYHDLQTVFQFVSLADELRFQTRSDAQVNLIGDFPEGLNNDQNLICRAAEALKARFPDRILGCDIHLAKNLPMAGGIGGGSSNAATALLVLNELWHLELSLDDLAELGLALGADVPVFVRGRAAFAEGRGERLTPIEVPEYWFLLLKPKAEVSTAKIFQHQELTRDSSPRTIRAFLSEGDGFTGLQQLISHGNDCENLVRKLYPNIDQALSSLSQYSKAQLTGTGACVFAPFETEGEAKQALDALLSDEQSQQWLEQAELVKGMNTSSLHADLQQNYWGVAKR